MKTLAVSKAKRREQLTMGKPIETVAHTVIPGLGLLIYVYKSWIKPDPSMAGWWEVRCAIYQGDKFISSFFVDSAS